MQEVDGYKKAGIIILLCAFSYYYTMASTVFMPFVFVAIFILGGMLSYVSSSKVSILTFLLSYICVLSANCSNPFEDYAMFYNAFIFILFPFLISFAVGLSFKKKQNFRETLTLSSLALIVPVIIALFKLRFFDKVEIGEIIVTEPLKNISLTLDSAYAMSYIADEATLQFMKEYISVFEQTILMLSPSIIITVSIMCAFILMMILKKLFIKISLDKFEFMTPFSHLIMSRATTLFLTFIMIITIFVSHSLFEIVLLNILVVLIVIYAGCGLSLVDFYFRKSVSHAWIRLIIYFIGFMIISSIGAVITFLNPVIILIIIGIIDSARDFRKIKKPFIT